MSPPDIDVARLRAALASLAGDGGTADAGRIYDALHGELTGEERRAVVNDLVMNPAAAEAWRLARELPPEPVAAATSRDDRWTWMSVAAGLLLAAGLGWQLLTALPSAPPAYRTGERASIAPAISEDAPLSRVRPVLRWTAIEGARYRVRVLTPDLELLAEADELAAPEYELAEEVVQRIATGVRILWQVDALVPGGATITSPTFNVRID